MGRWVCKAVGRQRWWMEDRGFLDPDEGPFQHNREETQWLICMCICNYIHLFSPFGYLQTFISAYFQKHNFMFLHVFLFKSQDWSRSFSCKNVHLMKTKRELGHLGGSLLLWALLPDRPSRTHGSWSSFLIFTAWAQHHSWSPARVWFYCISSASRMALPWLPSEEFASTDDYWPQRCSPARWWVQSLTYVESTEVTLTNWGYFIIEVYQGDTVTPSPLPTLKT